MQKQPVGDAYRNRLEPLLQDVRYTMCQLRQSPAVTINNGVQDARALCVITPAAGGLEFFRAAAEVINAAAGGPPDRQKMAEIMRRHGLTPAPA